MILFVGHPSREHKGIRSEIFFFSDAGLSGTFQLLHTNALSLFLQSSQLPSKFISAKTVSETGASFTGTLKSLTSPAALERKGERENV